MQPKAGYNQKKYNENYGSIDWSKTRKKNYENNKTINKEKQSKT